MTLLIACTLTAADFKDRVTWIASLTQAGLRSYRQDDLSLQLRYAPAVEAQVREMVRRESECCAFLSFALDESEGEIVLTVTAPEEAREAAAMLFKQFTGAGEGCCASPRCCS